MSNEAIPKAKITTRKWKSGKLISETTEQVDWEPNEADLDLVQIGCECGNKFEMPWDAVAFGALDDNSHCGKCGESGLMEIIADPSPNKQVKD